MAMGIVVMALLAITAAVSTAATPDEIPVALTQPIGHLSGAFGAAAGVPVLPETAMMMMVGSGLLGLGAVMRRSGRNTNVTKVSGVGNQVSGLG